MSIQMTDKEWKEAWLKSANSIETEFCKFLCDAFESTSGRNIREQMERFSHGERTGNYIVDGWFSDCDPNRIRYRCLFACLFSNMTVAEFEEICNAPLESQ